MAPRSIWNGMLAFGEIAIPVKLFSLVAQQRIQFREVRLSDGSRISHRRIGSVSGQEVPSEQIRKSYETPDGQQVVVSDQELATLHGPRTKLMELEHFVPAEQLAAVYYERAYVLGAQGGGERAYRLLHAALQRSGKIAVGRFVLRTRERPAAVAAHGQALRLYTLRFADELVRGAELAPPSFGREPSDKELEMAQRLIDMLADVWEPEQYRDVHRDRVLALITAKAEGRELEAPASEPPKPAPDLLAALEQSIATGRRRRTAKAPRAPAGSKAAKPKARSR
ncbi:MAG: Ku protein [Solirubrobacteraceae bacterium]